MTKKQKEAYQDPEALCKIIHQLLYKQKFRLHCGHHVTFGEVLGNDVIIRNGKTFIIICTLCGY